MLEWPNPAGKSLLAFVRPPEPSDKARAPRRRGIPRRELFAKRTTHD